MRPTPLHGLQAGWPCLRDGRLEWIVEAIQPAKQAEVRSVVKLPRRQGRKGRDTVQPLMHRRRRMAQLGPRRRWR